MPGDSGDGSSLSVAIESAVSSLYTNYILRDVVAKVVPGSILLLMPAHTYLGHGTLREYLSNMSTAEWGFFVSLSWILSYAAQDLGERIRVIQQWPREWNDWRRRYDMRVRFSRMANNRERRLVERYVVIKEACGGLFMCSLLAFLASSVISVSRESSLIEWASKHSLLALLVAPIMGLLFDAHARHVDRQYAQMEAVLRQADIPSRDHETSSGTG